MSDQAEQDRLDAQMRGRAKLGEVVTKLAPYNLQGQITFGTIPTIATGAFSDIYVAYLTPGYLQRMTASPICLVCRRSKAKSDCEATCGGCKTIWTGKLAMKQFRVHMRLETHHKAIAQELYILSKLSHPNLLPFFGYVERGEFPALVTPWAERGDLFSLIKTQALDRSDETTLKLACGIASGVAYLHEERILHRDLKSCNIFLTSDDKPIVADFGLSVFSVNDRSIVFSPAGDQPGTVRYLAQEIIRDGKFEYSEATDCWALGMVFYELITHKLPYFGHSEVEVITNIVRNAVYLPVWMEESREKSNIIRALRDMCGRCWSKKPEERPSTKTIVEELLLLTSSSPKPHEVLLDVTGNDVPVTATSTAGTSSNSHH